MTHFPCACIALLGRIAVCSIRRDLLLQVFRGLSFNLSLCVLGTTVSPAKVAERIEMPFEMGALKL